MISRNRKRGFTLIEILIVVIILGILAAIVIPQFTNASQDARRNSLTAQMQTLRAQVELYRLQHRGDLPPTLEAGGAGPAVWAEMTAMTDADHNIGVGPTFTFGPYLQQPPTNPVKADALESDDVHVINGAIDYGTGGVASPNPAVGWILNTDSGKVWATSRLGGFIFNEADPTDPNNDL